jgi:hypothetical protein
MSRRIWLTATSITGLILFLVTLQLARTTFAGAPEPQPPPQKIKGPDIKGDLIVTFFDDGIGTSGSVSTVVAECKGKQFVVGPFFFPGSHADFLVGIQKVNLESGWKAENAGPKGCLSKNGGETLTIEKVKSYDVLTDTVAIVDIKIIGITG